MKVINCAICGKSVKGLKGLSKHIVIHKISPEDYTRKFLLSKPPLCKCGCGKETKYVKKEYRFGDFVFNHHKPTLGKQWTYSSEKRKEALSKRKKTNVEKYGVENLMFLDSTKESIKRTCKKKYGVEWISQTSRNKEVISDANKHTYKRILEFCDKKNYIPLFDELTYTGCRDKYKFKCQIHNCEFVSEVFLVSLDGVNQCPECKVHGSSQGERDIISFVGKVCGLYETNYRKIIAPFELDIFIPDKNLAIEYNGLYWHSEERKDKRYHFNKFDLCQQQNVKLFQVFEDEWRDKQGICKSMIKSFLGESKNSFNARSCEVVEDHKEVRNFLDDNHLQGNTNSRKTFSLVCDGNIVFALTLRKPFTKNKNDTVEIARVCSLQNAVVRGGFSKLMKYVKRWAKEEGFRKIITYSDCRYSTGDVYRNNEFKFVKHTGIGYDYTDFVNRFNRFKFRAKNGISEKEIAKDAGVYRIYNAGNYLWEYLL